MENYTAYYILKDESELEYIHKTYKAYVLFFNASWCGPCQKLKPSLNNAILSSNEIINKINNKELCIVSIDINTFDDLTHKYGVDSVPTLFYCNGKDCTRIKNIEANEILQQIKNLM